ncbi:MAG: SDR family oxidoreductase [Flavobacteriales bacterium]|mgnify:CR=1 FL=1|jgi:dTDP-4-dehydrorhamnose reductase|nr:SDR family oxidoreductase [Flavobacteriales bacterium]
MIYLITGSNGLLGQKLLKKLKDFNFEVIATSKGKNRNFDSESYTYESLDITDKDEVNRVLNLYKPNVIFNTAAMTNVDLCEDEMDNCDKLNTFSVAYLADAALSIDAHLIHISTDFIFDGKKDLYSEEDPPNPLSYYGKSKLEAEKLLYNHNCNWSILRTIVIYGVGKKLNKSNIVLWAKDQLENHNQIKIIDDEFRAPTFAEDLAQACINTALKKEYGIFHVSGKELMSIYEIVESIANFYNFDKSLIKRIKSKELNQKAKRPKKTSFNLLKAKNTLDYSPKSFLESLEIIHKQLKNN